MSLALVVSSAFEVVPMGYPAGERRSMSAVGFARLLERLHKDSEQAAQEYERLRRALVKFFDWRGVSPPDECADEVFDRLAHKLEDTTEQSRCHTENLIRNLTRVCRIRTLPTILP